MKSRIAVLASGGGSNLQAILDHFERLGDARGGDVVVVAAGRATAGALDRARRAGIKGVILTRSEAEGRDRSPDRDLSDLLREYDVDLIALAGYLHLVPPEVVRRYEGRIVNVHPALLPAFGGTGMYGRHVHQAVLDAGVTITGVTVHFVDAEYDHGRIIAQWPVPVLAGDDPATLAARVLRVEHLLFPRVLDGLAAGRITLSSSPALARLSGADVAFSLSSVPHEDACLAKEIELALGR